MISHDLEAAWLSVIPEYRLCDRWVPDALAERKLFDWA